MIAVKVEGRLGNQLFQYAFAYTVSKKLDTRFYIDKSEYDFMLPQYFTVKKGHSFAVDNLFKINGYKSFFTLHLRQGFYNMLRRLYNLKSISIELDAEPHAVLNSVTDKTVYSGYFQSPLFFDSYREDVKKQFQIKPDYLTQFQKKYSSLYAQHKIVCVHIRRTDYLNLGVLNLGGEDLSTPLSYYKKAINCIKDKNVHFVFVGDDHDYIATNFADIGNKTISTDPEIMDFQHLLNANYCIIANSTFSWWGAWLNAVNDKKIYAPQYFMGHLLGKTWPPYIYPTDWNIIEFNDAK